MINHPSITYQIAAARERDLGVAAARHRLAREAFVERSIDRRPTLTARPPQVHCACR